MLVALSTSYPLVLLGRVLTGPPAVWLPLEIALVHNRITGETARKAIGMLVAALTVGIVLGSLAAGAMASVVSSVVVVLLVPAVLVAACAGTVFVAVPESMVRTARTIDYVGFAGLAAFMIFLLLALRAAQVSGFDAPASVVPLVLVYLTAFLFGAVTFGTQTITTSFLAARPGSVGYGFGLAPGVTVIGKWRAYSDAMWHGGYPRRRAWGWIDSATAVPAVP